MEGTDPKDQVSSAVAEPTTQVLTKHLLERSWSIWTLCSYGKGGAAQNTAMGSFSTVEEFWAIYNSMKKPSDMVNNSKVNVIIVRDGEKPEWEDNPAGGEWLMLGGKNWRDEKIVDEVWEELLLRLIGGTFEHSNEILCMWLQIRGKYDKISIWTDHAKDEEKCMNIGHDMLSCLREGIPRPGLQYTSFEDQIKGTQEKPNAYVEIKPIYTIDADKEFVAPASNNKKK